MKMVSSPIHNVQTWECLLLAGELARLVSWEKQLVERFYMSGEEKEGKMGKAYVIVASPLPFRVIRRCHRAHRQSTLYLE